MNHLFMKGDFTLNSGKRSKFKIECDAFTTADWDGLAVMAREMLPRFGEVWGVPRGGLSFALALSAYRTYSQEDPVLIAEDVCTTGGSIERFRELLLKEQPLLVGRKIIGVCVFARESTWPDWVKPLFCFNPILTIHQREQQAYTRALRDAHARLELGHLSD